MRTRTEKFLNGIAEYITLLRTLRREIAQNGIFFVYVGWKQVFININMTCSLQADK